jgi:hypothetical protein
VFSKLVLPVSARGHTPLRRGATWPASISVDVAGDTKQTLEIAPLSLLVRERGRAVANRLDDGRVPRGPARAHVSRARCSGLTSTSATASLASTGRIRSASRRPVSVNGMSVVPVCCPLRLHAVSPCRIGKTFTPAFSGSDVVGLCRTNPARRYRLPHFQPVISGMSSPYRAMYSWCSISLLWIACLA